MSAWQPNNNLNFWSKSLTISYYMFLFYEVNNTASKSTISAAELLISLHLIDPSICDLKTVIDG